MTGGHGDGAESMDISQHQRTWVGFVKFIEWSVIGIAIVMFLLMLFRTHG